MASSELDLTVTQAYELDSTDATIRDDEEQDSTDSTISDDEEDADEKVSMDADSTEATRDKFAAEIDAAGTGKIPSSEIVVRTIAVERTAPLADLPADADAAFGQWLSGSGLASSKH